jgi:hypothetical protein
MGKLSLASIALLVSVLALMVTVLFVLQVPPLGLVAPFLAMGIAIGLAFVFAHGSESGSSR